MLLENFPVETTEELQQNDRKLISSPSLMDGKYSTDSIDVKGDLKLTVFYHLYRVCTGKHPINAPCKV